MSVKAFQKCRLFQDNDPALRFSGRGQGTRLGIRDGGQKKPRLRWGWGEVAHFAAFIGDLTPYGSPYSD